MFILGLTGSIGMGKTTTSRLFAAHGVPVHDADATVHALYAGVAVEPVEAEFPGVAVDGRIDRTRLSARVLGDKAAIARLEAIVHPLVQAAEAAFLLQVGKAGAGMAVLDIPLLFETGGEQRCDAVAVVTAPADIQRERVLARPDMTRTRFEAILARQLPDAQKRRRAHFLIETHRGLAAASAQVDDLLRALAGRRARF